MAIHESDFEKKWRLWKKGEKVARYAQPDVIGVIKEEARLYPFVLWPGADRAHAEHASDIFLIVAKKFSELARVMGWDARTANTVKRFCRAAQVIAPYDSFNTWFAARGDQNRYREEYTRFKRMLTESQALDGYVGEKRADFVACEID